MTDEKIIYEKLDDEQLDQVAGGTQVELSKDSLLMRDLGLMKNTFPRHGDNNDMYEVENLERAWALLKISFIFGGYDGYNEYYNSKGEEISRDQAIKMAVEQMNAYNLNPYEYFWLQRKRRI